MVSFKSYASVAGDWVWRGDARAGTRRAVAMLAQPEDVGNRNVMLALARIPPGQSAPWHVHEDFEEFVYVLDGEGEFRADDHAAPRPVGPGSINVIPPGTWHAHGAIGETDLVFLWGYSPPGKQLEI